MKNIAFFVETIIAVFGVTAICWSDRIQKWLKVVLSAVFVLLVVSLGVIHYIESQQTFREQERKTILIAERAVHIVSQFDLFLMPFAGKHGGPGLEWLSGQESFAESCDARNDDETLAFLVGAFQRSDMFDPSPMMKGRTRKHLSMFDLLRRQAILARQEADKILGQYGAVPDPLILAVDGIRSRAEMLERFMPLLLETGVETRWRSGVDEQWAKYFSHLCLANIKLKRLCFRKLNLHGYKK